MTERARWVDRVSWYAFRVYHYTSQDGYNAISAQPDWRFRASDPPADHPRGAYFTTLGRDTKNLANRLRIPRDKVAWFFEFEDAGDLQQIDGDRGRWVFHSTNDYLVVEARQADAGATGL